MCDPAAASAPADPDPGPGIRVPLVPEDSLATESEIQQLMVPHPVTVDWMAARRLAIGTVSQLEGALDILRKHREARAAAHHLTVAVRAVHRAVKALDDTPRTKSRGGS